MLKFIHTFAISLVCSLALSLALFLCHFFCLFLRSTVKNYKRKGALGGVVQKYRRKAAKNIWHFLPFLAVLSALSLSLFSFFSFCALLGIYIFKWKVKLIINCEEKVAAYVFASYCQLYAFSWPVPSSPTLSLSRSIKHALSSCLYYSHTRYTLYGVRIIKSSSVT